MRNGSQIHKEARLRVAGWQVHNARPGGLGEHRLVHLRVFSVSPGKWRENRWKTFLKGNNQPHSADKPEGIYSFIHSLTHSPPGRWGARVIHTHRGILRPGTEAVPTAFRDA